MHLADNHGTKYPVFVIAKAGYPTGKDRATVHADNVKLRQGFGRNVWKEIKAIQEATGMVIYGNPTAWWNEQMSLKFLQFHFGRRQSYDDPVLLLWDSLTLIGPPLWRSTLRQSR
jgi:hypothetical protein